MNGRAGKSNFETWRKLPGDSSYRAGVGMSVL